MSRLSFRAWRGKHYIGLAEVLSALGRTTANAVWELRLDEVAPGPEGDRLHTAADGPRIGTRELMLTAFPDGQIIDGELRAFAQPGDAEPLLVLYAVDSTDWDLETTDPAVLAAAREAFPGATGVG